MKLKNMNKIMEQRNKEWQEMIQEGNEMTKALDNILDVILIEDFVAVEEWKKEAEKHRAKMNEHGYTWEMLTDKIMEV